MLIYGKTGLGKSHGVVVDAWFTGFADTTEEDTFVSIWAKQTGKMCPAQKQKKLPLKSFLIWKAPGNVLKRMI